MTPAHVAVVSIGTPADRGLLTTAGVDAARRALRAAEDDDDIKAVVLRPAATDLCRGFDLDDAAEFYQDPPGRPPAKRASLRARLAAHDRTFWGEDGLIARVARSRKVTVAAAGGRCYGPGLYLALASDLVIAGESSRFGCPRWRYLGADGDLMMLINAIGLKRARSAVFLGTEWPAEKANEIGLTDLVVPDIEVTAAAEELAGRVAHVVRDGLAAEKYLTLAAMQRAQVGTGFAIATLMGAMASNIHHRSGEPNVLRERRTGGTSAAVRVVGDQVTQGIVS